MLAIPQEHVLEVMLSRKVVYSIDQCDSVIKLTTIVLWGTRWRSWLRQCATSRKVAGSILDGVIGIFH